MPKEAAELRAGTLAGSAKGSKGSAIDFSQLQISPSGQVQPSVPVASDSAAPTGASSKPAASKE